MALKHAASQMASPIQVKKAIDEMNTNQYQAAYERLAKLHEKHPHDVDVMHLYGAAAYNVEKFDQARSLLERRIERKPYGSIPGSKALYHDVAESYYFLAITAHAQGHYDEAIKLFGKLINEPETPKSTYRKAVSMMGRTLQAVGEHKRAVKYLEEALQIEPNCGVTLSNLAKLYVAIGRIDEAIDYHNKALAFVTKKDERRHLQISLASLYKRVGMQHEFETVYNELFNDNPSYGLILEHALYLPNIYQDIDEMYAHRDRYIQQLLALLDEAPRMKDIHKELTVSPTFLLAYHGESDKDLMAALGHLFHNSYQPQPLPPQPKRQPGQKIRVGVVSRFWSRNHTIGKLYTGLFENLNPDEFEVVMFHVVPDFHPNAHKGWVKQNHIYKAYLPEQNRELALAILHKSQLDVLFYSDIGMDTTTYFQAFERVAPAQCVTFGHPSTTGIPNMDYFISSKGMESENPQQYYTEELIMLDTVPAYYEKPKLEKDYTKAYFGYDENKNYYFCPQSLFKMHPEIDDIFKGILERDPNGEIIMLAGQTNAWREQLVERFTRTMGEALVKRIQWQKRLSRLDLVGLMKVSDVMLDPIHFGGGNTSYEAFSVGTPIVTCPSKFLKCKITEAQYRMMGYTELIATNYEDYITKAVALGTNKQHRAAASQAILERCDVLFENDDTVRELEQAFKYMVQQAEAKGFYQ